MTAQKPDYSDPVAAYKALLRDIIDHRPSGTRQKIAEALGKHKSFVSQIANPSYAVPVPAKHLSTIFEICHFSQEERRQFIEAYLLAHPGRHLKSVEGDAGQSAQLTIELRGIRDPERRAEVVENIRLYAEQAIALAKRWEERETRKKRSKGGIHEKADKRGR
jgi:hypothetical protein